LELHVSALQELHIVWILINFLNGDLLIRSDGVDDGGIFGLLLRITFELFLLVIFVLLFLTHFFGGRIYGWIDLEKIKIYLDYFLFFGSDLTEIRESFDFEKFCNIKKFKFK